MTDADVERLGVRYRQLVSDVKELRTDLAKALDAVYNREVDVSFGRELDAALDRLNGWV